MIFKFNIISFKPANTIEEIEKKNDVMLIFSQTRLFKLL